MFLSSQSGPVNAERPAASRRPGIARLLAVLSEREASTFFPQGADEALAAFAGEFHRLDPTRIAPGDWGKLLADHAPEVLVTCWSCPALPEPPPASLRYVCHLAGSVRQLVTRRHLANGLVVTNWGGSIARGVAEWALFHILASLRGSGHWLPAMHRDGAWKTPDVETASLFGRRVGLHGFGHIARELVRLMRPFSVNIAVHAPDLSPALARRHGVERCADLDQLFAGNDIVVELAPLLPETTGIVRERHLRLLPKGGVFVNVGRGAVVDPDALQRVAREGNVRFGLDVYTDEPLPADSALRGLPNVVLTPHLGGPTLDRRRDAGALALANLRAYALDRPLQARITAAIFEQST